MKVFTPCAAKCGTVVEIDAPEFSDTSVVIPTPCDCEPMAAAVRVRITAVREVSSYGAMRHKDGLVWMAG